MSAGQWTPERRARLRERLRETPGLRLWPDVVLGLLDALDMAEKRAAEATGLRAQLDAVAALHRPAPNGHGEITCATCVDGGSGWSVVWPCSTGEAMSARGES